MLEVERDRLAEYVRVLSKRLAAAEEKASEAEFYLRDERRKTAKLERMLEQGWKEETPDSDSVAKNARTLLGWNAVQKHISITDKVVQNTELDKKAGARFGGFCSCWCL